MKLFLLMFLSSIVTADTCPRVHIVEPVDEPWTQRDQRILDTAKVRCGQIYKDSPCLISFEKVTTGQYRAICGQKRPAKK